MKLLLRSRKAFPGDQMCVLLRTVETSIGTLEKGTLVTPLSFGFDADGRRTRTWTVAGKRVTYVEDDG